MCAAFFTPFMIEMILTAHLPYKLAMFCHRFYAIICATGNINFANRWHEIDTEFFPNCTFTYSNLMTYGVMVRHSFVGTDHQNPTEL